MTGHGGWPMTVFLDPDGRPLLRRHLLPAGARASGMPSFRMVMEAVVDAFETQREEIREKAAVDRASGSGRSARSSRATSCPGRPTWSGRSQRPAAARRTAATAASAAPRSSRPPPRWSCLLARGETEAVELTLDGMLAGGIYDQLGGGFARYSVDAVWLVPHFEKMLYDNALLARAYLHGWQNARPRALPARLRGDPGLGAARDARPRGRLLLRARRRLRGRGGPLLRLDHRGPDPRRVAGRGGAERGDPRLLGRQRGGQLRGLERPPPAPTEPRRGAARPRPRRAQALLAARGAAGPARPRRQAPHLLERADDRGARRRRRRARPRGLPRRRPRLRRVRPRPSCATRAATCCAPTRTAAPTSTPTSRTTPSCSRRCSPSTRRPSSSAGSTRPRGAGRDDDRALRRPRARRLLHDLRRPRGADRPPQGGRRPPDPLRQQLRRDWACCGWRR